jgi:hypothetical protein
MAFTSFTALLPDSLKEKLGIRPRKAAVGTLQGGPQLTPKRPLAPLNADTSLLSKTSFLSPIMQTEVRIALLAFCISEIALTDHISLKEVSLKSLFQCC